MVVVELATRDIAELEQVIERGLATFVEVGQALLEIRDGRLYRQQGWGTFEDYCKERWGWERRHAYRLMDGAQVASVLCPTGHIPTSERQARELVPLLKQDEAQVVKVWQELKQEYGEDVTADRIRRVVSNRLDEIKRKRDLAERRDTEIEAGLPASSDRYRLLQGDLLAAAEGIQAGSIDVIITDPPYPREYLPVYEKLGQVAKRVLKAGGSALIMVGQSYLPDVLSLLTQSLRYHWTLAYLTPGGQAPQIFPRKVNTFWKPVLWLVNGEYEGQWVGDVVRSATNDNDKRYHDWGQSESGMADLVERFSKPGWKVLDPFVGGGTTGAVALRLGRQFIGIDQDEQAIRTASLRLAAECK